ncbi:hypothetical protein BU17DRAFT_79779 [Hysterangium stoloniferum]|nr:hypothetical protein BU17DRAFT_79779 [Hysterangium stoloniferum]
MSNLVLTSQSPRAPTHLSLNLRLIYLNSLTSRPTTPQPTTPQPTTPQPTTPQPTTPQPMTPQPMNSTQCYNWKSHRTPGTNLYTPIISLLEFPPDSSPEYPPDSIPVYI